MQSSKYIILFLIFLQFFFSFSSSSSFLRLLSHFYFIFIFLRFVSLFFFYFFFKFITTTSRVIIFFNVFLSRVDRESTSAFNICYASSCSTISFSFWNIIFKFRKTNVFFFVSHSSRSKEMSYWCCWILSHCIC